MQPKRLTLKNVFQHYDLVHEFLPGITGVTGRNGCGKSNFLEALHFAQTGNTSSDYTKSDLLSWGADTGHTIFEFLHNGVEYKLTRRIHTSLVKLESPSLEKPLKAAEANAFMESAIGMSFKGFYETCWTPQGTLVNILTCTHAARVSFFQRLAKTREAEVIRGIIQEKGLNKLPTFLDRTAEIQELTEELTGLASQTEALGKQCQEYENVFTQYQEQYSNVQAILAKPTQAQHDQSVASARASLTTAQQNLKKAQDSVNLVEVPEASGPTPEMEQAKANSENRARHRTQLKSLEDSGMRLTESMPDVVEDPELMRVELEKENQTLMELKPRHDLAQNRECPTCRRPYEFEGGEQAREAVIADFQQKQSAYTARHTTYMQKKRAFDQFQNSSRSIQAQLDSSTAQWNSVKQQLDAIPETEFDAEAYAKVLADYSAYMNYLQVKQQHENHLRSLEQIVDRCNTALGQAEQAVFVTDADRQNAKEFMTNYNDIITNRQKLAADLSGAQSRQQALGDQRKKLEAEQAKKVEVAHTRNLFERAREKLHRDVLPKLVMQKMLYGLNSLLDQYLSVFDTNFMAYINEDFDFLCSFSTKSDVPARALSGGQKVALSLAFKFAVSDLTASSVPFLVLDEPTVWLDEINKPRLAEVLTKAREVTEKGVYVLVATHEPLLFPAFSRIFDVS